MNVLYGMNPMDIGELMNWVRAFCFLIKELLQVITTKFFSTPVTVQANRKISLWSHYTSKL